MQVLFVEKMLKISAQVCMYKISIFLNFPHTILIDLWAVGKETTNL